MKNFKNNKAFSLTEMLVSMIIAAVMILTIGVISSISTSTYSSLSKEAQVYKDIAYGFKLMQNRMRSVQNYTIIPPAARPTWASSNPPWINLITLDNAAGADMAFALYRTTSGTAKRMFVYVPDTEATINCINRTNCEVIFEVLDPNNSSANLDLTLSSGSNAVTAQISRTNADNPFDMTTTILKRAK